MMNDLSLDTVKAVLLGHAVGDALGVPVEFETREALDASPITDMMGNGTYSMPAGSWSDDTGMTLCALEALGREVFTWDSVMENFGKWYYLGQFTPTGKTVDVGRTCSQAIENYFDNHQDIDRCGKADEHSNGNGSLMRILPFALFSDKTEWIEKASSLTHSHRRSQMACGIYAYVLSAVLEGGKGAYEKGLEKAAARYGQEPEWSHFAPLLHIEDRRRDSINSTGYVVDTLEASLWCLVTTDSYKECVLKAVNLGFDTDTTAAVAGGLAGAVYGLGGIPQAWLRALKKRNEIEALCRSFYERMCANAAESFTGSQS